MIQLYKDIEISYLMLSLTVIFALSKLANINLILFLLIMPLWIFVCAFVYTKIAVKRFGKISLEVSRTCEISKGLNLLFGLYKGRANSKIDLVLATHIAGYLRVYGKNTIALNLLLQYEYDVENIFKSNRFIVYKFTYYSTLAACYYHLGKKEEAQNAYIIADGLYNSPGFPLKIKEACKTTHQLNRLIILGDGKQQDEILALLSARLSEKKDLFSQVHARFSIACILIKNGETEKIKEHIEFIRENGGDTVFARCALANNFSDEFLKKIDDESYEPQPIKIKYHKVLILSVAVTILIIALAVLILSL